MELKNSLLPTSETYSGAILSDMKIVLQSNPLMLQTKWGGITAEPYSYYKVNGLIHNSQEIDKEIVGISENTRFRVTPAMNAAYLDAVKRGDTEAAQRIVEMFGDTKVTMPSNVVTPSLRAELEKLGVPFKETDNQG